MAAHSHRMGSERFKQSNNKKRGGLCGRASASPLPPSKDLRAGRNVLLVAHANSLRGVVKHIDEIADEVISDVGMPTGIPLVMRFDKRMRPVAVEGSEPPLRGAFLERKGLLREARRVASPSFLSPGNEQPRPSSSLVRRR